MSLHWSIMQWGSVTQRRRGLLSQVCSDRWAVDRDNIHCPVLAEYPGQCGLQLQRQV